MNGAAGAVFCAVRDTLDELSVPDGALRDALLRLAAVGDSTEEPGHSTVATVATAKALEYLRSLYEPRSPLQAQVDVLRGERVLRELRRNGEMDD